MDIMWVLVIFFAFITIASIAFAFYFPEWIGITGKKAIEILEHQKDKSDDSSKN